MNHNRRSFFRNSLGAAMLGAVGARAAAAQEKSSITDEELKKAGDARVLTIDELKTPVKIRSMELLRNGGNFIVRVRTTDGADGLGVPNALRLQYLYPFFVGCVAPFFIGKDARDLEEPLMWELYRWRDNYKYQGLALWICQTAAETAILDLLGKLANKPIGDLLGGVKRREIPIYYASGRRENQPEAEVEYLQKLVAESGVKAIKFRVGGRMSRNADYPADRSVRLIPLVRKTFGDSMTLYADSNSTYDVPHAIEIGRLMEKYNYGFFEEPCEFDHLEETRQVTEALTIPVAGGEQEFSMRRFRWQIQNRVVDIVQPDVHYFGGMIRSMRVARMAQAAGMKCTPHMSGSGLGYVEMAHFVSCIPNPSEFHEFKGNSDVPFTCPTSSLTVENGIVKTPTGPGLGLTLDPAWVNKAVPVKGA